MIVDFRMRLRTIEGLKAWRPPIPEFAPYVDMYKMQDRLSVKSVEETIAEMEAAGVTAGVIFASASAASNEYIWDVASKHKQFVALMGLDFSKGVGNVVDQLVRQSEWKVFKGVNLTPFMLKIPIDDPKLYAVYSLCLEHGLVPVVHTSMHFYNEGYWFEYEKPEMVDKVCTDFPSLPFVACHGMNPQWDVAMALAHRHPNLYLEVSSLVPKTLPDGVLKAMNTWLKHKFLWGSNYPLLPFDSVEQYKEVLSPEVQALVFHENAYRVLGGML